MTGQVTIRSEPDFLAQIPPVVKNTTFQRNWVKRLDDKFLFSTSFRWLHFSIVKRWFVETVIQQSVISELTEVQTAMFSKLLCPPFSTNIARQFLSLNFAHYMWPLILIMIGFGMEFRNEALFLLKWKFNENNNRRHMPFNFRTHYKTKKPIHII